MFFVAASPSFATQGVSSARARTSGVVLAEHLLDGMTLLEQASLLPQG